MHFLDYYIDFKRYFKNRKLLKQIKCKLYPVENLVSYGSRYGHWTIPANLLNEKSICYLVGAGEDISFDLAVDQIYGCEIHIFDPTPKSIKFVRHAIKTLHDRRIFLHEKGLWNKKESIAFYQPENEKHVSHSIVNLQHNDKSIELPVDRLSSIMEDLGHSSIDLLKLDIEGAEYEVINSIWEDKLNIRAIAIEFDEAHSPLDEMYYKRIGNSIQQLQNLGYIGVHVKSDFNILLLRKDVYDDL